MNIRMLPLKLKALIAWPFELGRIYRTEHAIVWSTRIGIAPGEPSRTISVPKGYEHDSFTGVPNLRMRKGEGVLLSYRCLWGAGWRRCIWVSAAATVHDHTFEFARDDQGRPITFDESNAIFREILHMEGWLVAQWLYYWGVSNLAKARRYWNGHKDGRMPA